MQFLYVFILMFISIFGFTMLVHLFVHAILNDSAGKFEIYVRQNENIEELLANLEKSPNIGRVCIIVNNYDDSLRRLSEKYADVTVVGDPER